MGIRCLQQEKRRGKQTIFSFSSFSTKNIDKKLKKPIKREMDWASCVNLSQKDEIPFMNEIRFSFCFVEILSLVTRKEERTDLFEVMALAFPFSASSLSNCILPENKN